MTTSEPVKIGICGVGTVGQGVLQLINSQSSQIKRMLGRPMRVTCLGMRHPKPNVSTENAQVFKDIMEVARAPNVDVLVETIGGDTIAKKLVLEAIKHGKHVVTANKKLIALHGEELCSLAHKQDTKLQFEAAVGGGIPIIKVLREHLAIDTVSGIRAILNSTSNYILTAMAEGEQKNFNDALAAAQKLNYAEANPDFDIGGADSAHKLAILATMAFGIPLSFKEIYTESIKTISTEDIILAKSLGMCIKPLAIAQLHATGCELRVHPALLLKNDQLAQVNGVMNALEATSCVAGSSLYYGAGAGAKPTALSVLADLLGVVRQHNHHQADLASYNHHYRVPPIGEANTQHYIKLHSENAAQTMVKLKRILAEHKIGISQELDTHSTTSTALLTNLAQDKVIQAVLKTIKQNINTDCIQHIRTA